MDKIVKIYKALADKNRLRILKLLERKALCVCELSKILKLAQSSTSEHLKALKEVGLIEDKKESYWVNYYLIKGLEDKFVNKEIRLILQSLENERVVKKDRKQAKKARREELCNK